MRSSGGPTSTSQSKSAPRKTASLLTVSRLPTSMTRSQSQWLNHPIEAVHRHVQTRHFRFRPLQAGYLCLLNYLNKGLQTQRLPRQHTQKLRHDSAEERSYRPVSGINPISASRTRPTDLGGGHVAAQILSGSIYLVDLSMFIYLVFTRRKYIQS